MISIKLSNTDLKYLKKFVKSGDRNARSLTRARVLLLAYKKEKNSSIAKTLDIARQSVYNVMGRYREGGLEAALFDKPRPGNEPIYTQKHHADIVALACTQPPEGRKQWSLELMQQELRKRKDFKSIGKETIRLVLKKTTPSRG